MIQDLPRSAFIATAEAVDQPFSYSPSVVGDLWPMTWASDGNTYALVGDGTGFSEPTPLNTSCVAFKVDPDNDHFSGHDVNPAFFQGYGITGTQPNHKPTGILEANGKLMMFMQELNPNWLFGLATNARLITSNDLGLNWVDHGVYFNEVFATPTIAQAGQSYLDAKDQYIYLYSPKYNWFEEDELFLARVPMASIEDRSAYEYYSGDGFQSMWTADIAEMRPTLVNAPKYIAQCEVVYVAAIDRYLMAQWRLGTKEHNPFNYHYNELYLLESPTPWGPWSWFYYDTLWGENSLDYRYCGRMPAALFSTDGTEFYLEYAGYSSVQDPAATPYSLNLQKMKMHLV